MAGSVTPYSTSHGKRYRVRYRKPDHTQTDKRGFTTKREAELFLASVTVSKAAGDYIDPALARVSVGDLAPMWLRSKLVLKPSSSKPLEVAWGVHVAERWGQREISTIVPSEVQVWVSEMAGRRSPSVVIRAHGVLAGILDMAVTDRRLPRNPARGVKLPRKTGKLNRVYLSHDQVHTLAGLSAHPTLVLCLAYTGIRWGEATALRARHINFLRRRLNVEENAVKVGAIIHLGTTKGHERRSVPYPELLSAGLTEHCANKGPTQLVFGGGTFHMKSPDSVDGWFVNAVRRAQQTNPDFPFLTPHDLRHTAASLAISSGANVKAVQRMLGHASAAMSLDTYGDLFDDDLEMVAAKMQEAAREASVGKAWAGNLA